MFRTGQRVFLSSSREQVKGTVTKVAGDRFQVTWDDAERPSGRPRCRHWYGQEARLTIMRGEGS